ncbi:MAG: NAD(P)/FAD-dependent oxidoreductase [Lautropia sp.]
MPDNDTHAHADGATPDSGAFDADYLIIGAGIAGASVGWWLAPHGRVVVLEREGQPGYHTTGRSAALFMESYGTPQVRALTMASRAFLERPPPGFAEQRLLSPRGAMIVATEGQQSLLDAHWAVLSSVTPRARRLDPDAACARVPVLERARLIGAVLEPDAADMDVDAIHQGFLRGIRRAGGEIHCNAEVARVSRAEGGWRVEAGARRWHARVVLNAAGAWVDEIASLAGVAPIGIEPRRRSAMVFALPDGVDARAWPAVIGAAEDWYVKPDAGMMIGSPANADPVAPHDVQPEELDIAIAIDRIQAATSLRIRRPTRTWAGLRSFVADGDLVGGVDPGAPGFVWVAAQGGYGIQTAPAMGEACAALARGLPLPPRLAAFGLDTAMLGPGRLR